jgi:hypothetical protein
VAATLALLVFAASGMQIELVEANYFPISIPFTPPPTTMISPEMNKTYYYPNVPLSLSYPRTSREFYFTYSIQCWLDGKLIATETGSMNYYALMTNLSLGLHEVRVTAKLTVEKKTNSCILYEGWEGPHHLDTGSIYFHVEQPAFELSPTPTFNPSPAPSASPSPSPTATITPTLEPTQTLHSIPIPSIDPFLLAGSMAIILALIIIAITLTVYFRRRKRS